MKKNRIMSSAIAGVLALGLMAAGSPSSAVEKMEGMNPEGMEKCFGVAKAGMNDCKSGLHDCKGKARANGEKDSFLLVPKGTCDKIVGGKVG
ncbi:MAG: DUF2282 domain-containing protein [Nitrospinae bacterium]|nr:DUF2282 domain-containing protein [Nitrospinota bacterium]